MTVVETPPDGKNTPQTTLLRRHSSSLGDYAQQVIRNGWLTAEAVEEKIKLFAWILERAALNSMVNGQRFSVRKFWNAVDILSSANYNEPETSATEENPLNELGTVLTEIHTYDRNIPNTLRSLLRDDEDVTEQKIWIAWQGMMGVITAYQNGMATKTAIAREKTRTALQATMTEFNGSWAKLRGWLENFEKTQFGKVKTDYEAEPTLLTEMPDQDDDAVTLECNDGWRAIVRCDAENIQVYIVKENTILIFPVYFY